jgi:putative hemolysin
MNAHPDPDPFRLFASVSEGRFSRTLGASLEAALGLRQCRELYRRLPAATSPEEFAEQALRLLNVDCVLEAAGLDGVPRQGPAVVVANHPFGGIEGLALMAQLRRVRPDVKVLTNALLQRIPQLREAFIPVDILGAARGRGNTGALRRAIRWVRGGGVLLVFPAGTVSHYHLRRREVADPAWQPSMGALIRHCQAPVVPVYIPGHNGPLFQVAGLCHPRLRTALLPRMLLRQRGRTLRLRGGPLIAWSRLAEFEDDGRLIDYLRLRTYLLDPSHEQHQDGRPAAAQRAAEVIPAQSAALLEAEVAHLPPGQLLAHSGPLQVWQAEAGQIPFLLLEIGRLRELTFRQVGEGTARSFDLDRFDTHYLHFFLWHSERRELVGAYRVGRCDDILERFGREGLYTSTLFRYRSRLFDAVGPALELGRSFVRPEYQKSYAPLLLLWKGIGRFVVKHPRYRVLFGPVSITRDYSDLSRRLIAGTLDADTHLPRLARLVRPRVPFPSKPPRIRGCSGELARAFCRNMEEVATLVADLEVAQKGIPVLLRHYLNLGGKLLTFNLDPDFSEVLDGLVLVDLLQTDRRALNRYLGREGAEAFLNYQHLVSGAREALCA